jgi:acyl-CoA synthetase (AMP-forming)/AMP-acid ligase II
VDSLPKTGTGKILKKDIRKKYWQGQETMRQGLTVAAPPKAKSGD